MPSKRAPVYVLEGWWDRTHEPPQVLPYLDAYQRSHSEIDLLHRTFRSAADLEYYLERIRAGSRAFIYIATHSYVGALDPADSEAVITAPQVNEAFTKAKADAVAFLHFGSCEFLQPESGSRRKHLSQLLRSLNGAQWVSGYAKSVDWLPSMLLDLALVSEVYVPWYTQPTHKVTAEKRVSKFLANYQQLARSLGFSAISNLTGTEKLFPSRVR